MDNRICDAGIAPELLNQFQVATFNTLEDDVSFWSKLIPESDRKRMEKQVPCFIALTTFCSCEFS